MDYSDKKKAVILDFYGEEVETSFFRDVLQKDEYKDSTLFFLTDKNMSVEEITKSIPFLAEFDLENVHIIVDDNSLNAIYTAKRIIDLAGTKDITLYCSDGKINFWSVVEKTFFTPVHSFKLKSQTQSTIACDEELNANVIKDACALVHGFPSDGQIELFHSSLIPSDIFNHGFTSRNGGISYMPGMRSLNLTFSNTKVDPIITVKENRSRLAKFAGFDENMFHLAQAVHGKEVQIVGDEIKNGGYDGMITNKNGVTVAAPGADCITNIFADPVQRVCGAAHAGWKGILSGMTTEMVRIMEEKFNCKAKDILVVMGPSVGKCCCEFGEEESAKFADIDPSVVVRYEGKRKPFIDLKKANRVLLERCGVLPEHIDDTSVTKCTFCNPELFYSYRRDGRPFGNQVGFIGLR